MEVVLRPFFISACQGGETPRFTTGEKNTCMNCRVCGAGPTGRLNTLKKAGLQLATSQISNPSQVTALI